MSYQNIPWRKDNKAKVVSEAEMLVRNHVTADSNEYLKITQGREEQWCADTVNYVYQMALGFNPFGIKNNGEYLYPNVSGLKNWALFHGRYHESKYQNETAPHFDTFQTGDIIIFKAPYTVKTSDGKMVTRHASHTGIIKEVKGGKVITIEGNANIRKKDKNGEYLLVHNDKDGQNGNQAIGDFQEVNHDDGVIERVYSLQDLADYGYSGYVDMQGLTF
jgi:hypothetical protein